MAKTVLDQQPNSGIIGKSEANPTGNYFLETKCLSRTHLKRVKYGSLAHIPGFIYQDPTDSMDFGTMSHIRVLEEDKFSDIYEPVVLPEGVKYDGRTSATKNELKRIKQNGFKPVKPDDWHMMNHIMEALKHPESTEAKTAKYLLLDADGDTEFAIWWRNPATRLKMKAKFDKVVIGSKLNVIDLKITKDASPEGFIELVKGSSALDLQDSVYREGAKVYYGEHSNIDLPVEMTFVLIERPEIIVPSVNGQSPKFGKVHFGIYQIPDVQKAIVDQWKDLKLEEIKACYTRLVEKRRAEAAGNEYTQEVWPGYGQGHQFGVVTQELPSWYVRRYAQELGYDY